MKNCFIIGILLIMLGCGSKKGIVTKRDRQSEKTIQPSKENTKEVIAEDVIDGLSDDVDLSERTFKSATEEYIYRYRGIAMGEMRLYKIPASITLAQGILESGSGKGRLAVEANNHFGIKCHDWTGQRIYHDDDRSQECFRKYSHPKYSYRDHSEFLSLRSRYADLFYNKEGDYKSWAKGLRAAGYATDRKYPEKLISLIERYELHEYDAMVLNGKDNKDMDNAIGPNNDVVSSKITHEVKKGDTLYSLSRKYNTSIETLKRLNGLRGSELSIGQILKINTN